MKYSLLIALLFAAQAFAQQLPDTSSGRYLPGGIWQAHNTHATQTSLPVNGSDPFNILTDWGNDIRLTYFDTSNAHWPELVASGNYINVAWWYLMETIYIATSTDRGSTWINRRLTDDSTTDAVIPQIASSDSNVYVVYRGGRPNWGVYMNKSKNGGRTWEHTQRLYYTARNLSEKPVVAAKDSMV